MSEQHIRQVEFYGGPLDGTKHQIVDPFGLGIEPAEIGMPTGPLTTDPKAWYVRQSDGSYVFKRIES